MQVQTILNRIQRHRSFVYGPPRLVQAPGLAIEVEVRPRANERTAGRSVRAVVMRHQVTTS